MLSTFFITLLILFSLVCGWYIIFPLLGGVILITATTWGLIVSSVVGLCTAILLLFCLGGIGMIVVGIIAFVWTLLAIIFFPVLFPILVPLLIILAFVMYYRRKRKQVSDPNNLGSSQK